MAKTYDPRMHTAEHILNAVMDRTFGCGRCFSAHIEKKKSKCDYHMSHAVSETDIRNVQDAVNDVIRSDLPVTEEGLSKEQADEQYRLDKLPSDAGGTVRIIQIGDVDACPCIGPHVVSTGTIGTFRITSHTFKDGVLRIRYKLSAPNTAE